MAEKVAKLGVSREKDFMYYVKDGGVWKVQRKQPGVPKGRPEKVADGGFEMDTNYIYFVDRDGDVARAKRAVGGQKRKKTARAPRRSEAGAQAGEEDEGQGRQEEGGKGEGQGQEGQEAPLVDVLGSDRRSRQAVTRRRPFHSRRSRSALAPSAHLDERTQRESRRAARPWFGGSLD